MSNNLTIEQIQAVIDKGGCLISDENEIHFGEMEIDGDILKFQYSSMLGSNTIHDCDEYVISESDWREATEEEIRDYLHILYRLETNYTKSDLISFGNYLLSKEREEMVTSKPERGIAECAIVIRQVSDADFENWKIK